MLGAAEGAGFTRLVAERRLGGEGNLGKRVLARLRLALWTRGQDNGSEDKTTVPYLRLVSSRPSSALAPGSGWALSP